MPPGPTGPPRALSLKAWSAVVGATQSKIVDLLVENLAGVLAVAAAVLLLTPWGSGWALAGAVLAVLALALLAWLLRRERRRRQPLLGAYAGPRLVLLVATAGAYLQRRPDSAGWVWAATGVALLAVLLEPTLRILLAKTEQVAVQLPGIQPVPSPPFSPDLLVSVTLLVAALGFGSAALGAPGWVYLIVTVLGVAATAAMLGHAARANLVAQRAATGLRAALERHAPAFAVYYGGTSGARSQLGMWLPYLERLDRPFVVITRHAETVPVIAELTGAPIVVPKLNSASASLDQLVVGSLKAAFYVQGSSANLSFQRFRRLTHVWLNHGDSDKAANFSARHATYDRIFVSGQQGVERYADHGVRVRPEQFAVVGRPQVERIEVRDQPLPPGAPRTVLYAPTWRGGRPSTDYSSLHLGDQIVAALLQRGSTVIFRPHPLSYTDPADAGRIRAIQQRLERDRTPDRPHVWGDRAERESDVADCINASDALVTDVSSVAADYLASGKPFAMVAIRAKGAKFREQFPMARVAYVVERDLSTLAEALDHLHGDDPLASARRAYRSHCLGDRLGREAASEFLRVAGKIVAGLR
jgi:hypothetical protein